jgi:hypothetical protein
MDSPSLSWLLLIVSLPTSSATARMRIWRALKALGCVACATAPTCCRRPSTSRRYRNWPTSASRGRQRLADGRATTLGGRSQRLPPAVRPQRRLRRTAQGPGRRRTAASRARRAPELARLQRKLQREFDAATGDRLLSRRGECIEAEAAWTDLNKRIDQPALARRAARHPTGRVPLLDAAKYQGRTWATRRRPWVDRVASAWLIRRFIDQEGTLPVGWPSHRTARSARSASTSTAPPSRTSDDRVTFETLMASFGLEDDPALVRLAPSCTALDVGGEPVPEAKGLEAVIAGARAPGRRRRPAGRNEHGARLALRALPARGPARPRRTGEQRMNNLR